MVMMMNMDALIPPDWQTGSKTVFPFHAFISHKRNDPRSDELRDLLTRAGLSVWHDGHQNLADRRVFQKVHVAIRNSRAVLVCVTPEFDNSAWCRAEYLGAIRVGNLALARRVIVVVMHPDGRVPLDLKWMPRFEAYRPDELDALARWLLDANKLPFEPGDPASGVPLEGAERATALAAALVSREDAFDPPDVHGRLMTCLACLVSEDVDAFSDSLFAARNVFVADRKEVGELSDGELALVQYVALRFSRSRNEDNRANAVLMLCELQERTRSAEVRRMLSAVVEREESAAVVELFLPWATRHSAALQRDDARAVFAAALRAPRHVRSYPPVAALLPESLRAWVFASEGLSKDVLSVLEQLKILSERFDYLLDGSPDQPDALPEITLPPVLGISTVETLCRELTGMVLPHLCEPKDFGAEGPKVHAACLDILARVVAKSEERQGWPLRDMQSWVMDYVLQPLLVCSMQPQHAERARELYFRVCEVMERWSDYAHEVPTYRRAWERFAEDPRFPNDYFLETSRKQKA